MKLELEFCEQRRFPTGGIVFLLVAIAFAAWTLLALHEARGKHDGLSSRVAALESAVQRRKMSETNISPDDLARKAKMRESEAKMVKALDYSWDSVLAPIEKTDGSQVALLALTHEQGGGGTRMTVEGADVPALIGFVDVLNANDPGHLWYLSNYQAVRQDGVSTIKGEILQSSAHNRIGLDSLKGQPAKVK